MNDRVQFLQSNTRISRCETPVNCSLVTITLRFPCQRFAGKKFSIGNISIQALATQHTQLDLSHIEPAAMLGCEMEFQSIQNAASLRRLKGFIQGSRDMSIQIVLHHDTSLGIREVLMNHLIDTVSPIHLRASIAQGLFCNFSVTCIPAMFATSHLQN